MADRNALRRLKSILADEDYGPKLARLNRADERRVLDLIESNPDKRGKAYRDEINRLDAARRERQRTRRQASQVDIESLRKQAYTHMRRTLDGKPKTIARGVKYMNIEQLVFASRAGREALRGKAKELPTIMAPDIEYEINPFWYR